MSRISCKRQSNKTQKSSERRRSLRRPVVPPGSISVDLDGQVIFVADGDLAGDEAEKLWKRLSKATSILISMCESLLGFSDQARLRFLDYVGALTAAKNKIAFSVGGSEDRNLLDAVLRLLPPDQGTDWAAQLERFAIEIAVMHYPDHLSLACDRICKKLRALGYAGLQSRTLVSKADSILQRLRLASVQAKQQCSPIKSVLADAPVVDNAVIPDGYSVTSEGVMRVIGEQRVPVSSAPILLTQRCRDIDTGCQQLTVSWRRDGHWSSHIAERSKIADRGTIIGSLANFGAPVTSANSGALVEYLAAYECANAAALEPVATTSQMGWHALDSRLVFLVGSQLLGAARESGQRGSKNGPLTRLQFVPADVGDQQLAAAIHTHGTFDGWKQAVRRVAHHPRILLVLFASFAAPLLKLLHVPSFVTDLCGETSVGKTTGLRLAASPWGNPSDADSGRPSLLLSWDATRVFLERAPAILKNLPLFVDESKRAARPELVVQKIYDFCGGIARGRGKPTGVDKMPSWNTVMFTTGEQAITSFSEDGGTRARVIEVPGPPFGKADAATGAVVNRLQADISLHYGFAGPAFVAWLLSKASRQKRLTKRHGEISKELVAAAGNNPIGIRLAAPLAAILVAEEFSHEALGLPWTRTPSLRTLCLTLVQQSRQADRPAAALRFAVDWARAHEDQFRGRRRSHLPPPPQGWAGRWERQPTDPALNFLGILPSVLDEVLMVRGFEPKSTLAAWRRRGWLRTQIAGGVSRSRYRTRIDVHNNWYVIAIRPEAITQAEQLAEEL